MPETQRAWVVTAVGDPAIPYEDRHGQSYVYDSKVQNHRQVSAGDLLFVKSTHSLDGFGRIRNLSIVDAKKTLARCPVCRQTASLRTIGGKERFRCSKGHVSDDPQLEVIDVKKYHADFVGDWTDLERPLPLVEVRRFYLKQSLRMSIIEVDREGLTQYVEGWEPRAKAALIAWSRNPIVPTAPQARSVDNGEGQGDAADAIDFPAPGSREENLDERIKLLRSIKIRRGQPQFRNALLVRFSGRCAISRCQVLGVLEAAHIRPYRRESDNNPSNGLLLRTDLHTLFDLDMIGIHPTDLRIHLHPCLLESEYASLQASTLICPQGAQLDKGALRERWTTFENAVAGARVATS